MRTFPQKMHFTIDFTGSRFRPVVKIPPTFLKPDPKSIEINGSMSNYFGGILKSMLC